ncbi:hypothetical protein O9G_003568 [Rozella allomycis CSF55]|uniref:Uncharacterized protein n=1 Tax=Rozella allomycis (strain CSF55) TaxID=988480 RepID=A0A075B0E4_ROZAC|nr:hypothetical protein O9G_003568 [Rozella allomycis CSF55]|eukprot:EPZ35850.1 hypothetical protein O9G_003568 [Rozella allomycis CSF55]
MVIVSDCVAGQKLYTPSSLLIRLGVFRFFEYNPEGKFCKFMTFRPTGAIAKAGPNIPHIYIYSIPIHKTHSVYFADPTPMKHFIPQSALKYGGYLGRLIDFKNQKIMEISRMPEDSLIGKIFKWCKDHDFVINTDYPYPFKNNLEYIYFYPSNDDKELHRSTFFEYVKELEVRSYRKYIYSNLALPFTALILLTPIPSFLFYYNIYCAYSLSRQYWVSQNLKRMLQANRVKFRPSFVTSKITDCYKTSGKIITDESIKKLSEDLKAPALEYHLVKAKSLYSHILEFYNMKKKEEGASNLKETVKQ